MGGTIDIVGSFARSIVRILSVVLALSLASAPVAECFAPPPGAEMPCCVGGHHDEACPHNGDAVQCCKQARVQDLRGVMVTKPHATAAQIVALPSPVVAAPTLLRVPVFHPLMFDTGPPGRSTRLHIVLSVFLI